MSLSLKGTCPTPQLPLACAGVCVHMKLSECACPGLVWLRLPSLHQAHMYTCVSAWMHLRKHVLSSLLSPPSVPSCGSGKALLALNVPTLDGGGPSAQPWARGLVIPREKPETQGGEAATVTCTEPGRAGVWPGTCAVSPDRPSGQFSRSRGRSWGTPAPAGSYTLTACPHLTKPLTHARGTRLLRTNSFILEPE